MTSWADFTGAHPGFARRVRQCFAIRKHATLATLRQDGSPRISGIDVLEVVHTAVGTPADHLVIESWNPHRGLQRRERR